MNEGPAAEEEITANKDTHKHAALGWLQRGQKGRGLHCGVPHVGCSRSLGMSSVHELLLRADGLQTWLVTAPDGST